jgi:threonine/homoserine/homoserine lactone efflux protein
VVLLVGNASDSDSDDPGLNWFKIAVGVVFLAMAAKQWTKRPRCGEPTETPSWMTTIETATSARALVLGAALSGANPKNLALTLAAAASIAEAGLEPADTAIAVAVFVALGSITVAGSVLFYLVDADRAARPLATVKQFMSDNNAVILMVVLLLLGAKLPTSGANGARSPAYPPCHGRRRRCPRPRARPRRRTDATTRCGRRGCRR